MCAHLYPAFFRISQRKWVTEKQRNKERWICSYLWHLKYQSHCYFWDLLITWRWRTYWIKNQYKPRTWVISWWTTDRMWTLECISIDQTNDLDISYNNNNFNKKHSKWIAENKWAELTHPESTCALWAILWCILVCVWVFVFSAYTFSKLQER